MDFGQEYYDMFREQAKEKVPFYMTYPMRNSFLEEIEYDKDCRKMQELYPKDARKIQFIVSRECDKMEHEGSMMFDEYPDRLLFQMLCRKIYREYMKEGSTMMEQEDMIMQLIAVMLMEEMYRRRCRYRRCRRWY